MRETLLVGLGYAAESPFPIFVSRECEQCSSLPTTTFVQSTSLTATGSEMPGS